MKHLFAALAIVVGCEPVLAQTRTIATSNITEYVAPPPTYPNGTATNCLSGYFGAGGPAVTACGADIPGCGTLAQPCATPQYVVNFLYQLYDWQALYAPTIQLASLHGGQFFYPGVQISGRLLGQPGALAPLVVNATNPPFPLGQYNPFVLQGDPTNPLGAFLTPCTNGLPCGIPALSLTDGAALKLSGVTLDTGLEPQDALDNFGSFLDIGNVDFGNAGCRYDPVAHQCSPSGNPNYNVHIACAWPAHGMPATLMISGPLTDQGGSSWAFLVAGAGCVVYPNNNGTPGLNIPVSINYGPHFTQAVMVADHSMFYEQGLTLSATPPLTAANAPYGLWALDNAVVQTASGGRGPRTCGPAQFLGLPLLVEDNAVCR